MPSSVERVNGRLDSTGKVTLPMRRSTVLPLFVLLLGGCPFEEDSLSTTPAAIPGDQHRDEHGVSVLVQTTDPRWPQIDAMALSDNYLFFAMNWHGVYKMPKFGGPIEVLDADDGAIFLPLATNGSDVIWQKITFDSNDNGFGQIKKQPVDGGSTQVVFGTPAPVQWKANRTLLVNVADDSEIVLTTQSLAGGEPRSQVLHDFTADPGPFDWVIDETFVYVWRAGGQTATLGKYPLAGGDGVLLAQSESSTMAPPGQPNVPVAGTLALDDDYVYVKSSRDLRRVPKAGGEMSTVLAAADNLSIYDGLLTVDDTSAFFAGELGEPYGILSVPKAGGEAVVLGMFGRKWNLPWQMLQSDGYLFLTSLDLSSYVPGTANPIEPGVILLLPKTPPAAP
jgi:hypothetical protein